ncbi:MAG: aminoacyl-tRNA hydrolase [Longimicrobiales bacterium]
MKVVCGLGNPGSDYEATRHNVGWWVLDRLLQAWHLGRFVRRGASLMVEGRIGEQAVCLLKPVTYMNRSGVALLPLLQWAEFSPATDLLVVVDDTALPVGRLRLRARGSAGGHNGLKSVELALHTRDYARLRIGVGEKEPGTDLADHVLAEFLPEEEKQIVELLPVATEAIAAWVEHGMDRAVRFNR